MIAAMTSNEFKLTFWYGEKKSMLCWYNVDITFLSISSSSLLHPINLTVAVVGVVVGVVVVFVCLTICFSRIKGENRCGMVFVITLK